MPTSAENEVDFEDLPRYEERRFVPQQAKLTELTEVRVLYEQLLAKEINSKETLEKWLLNRSELEAALDQAGNILYIRMTCETHNKERSQAYQDFITTVVPSIKPLDHALDQKYLEAVRRFPLERGRYRVYDRAIETNVALFVKENIPLQTQLDLLSQEYQTISGAMTVEFKGKERTLPEMGKFLQETDRELREFAWRSTAQRRLKDKDRLEGLFDKMLKSRHQIARQTGYQNYRDYKFRALHRYDYTPQDCKRYHDVVEHLVVPVYKRILDKRKKAMGSSDLRPWDLAVDPLGRPPLKPFDQGEELIEKCQKIFERVDKDLGKQFAAMVQTRLLDLTSRKGKAPGGYQSTLNEARHPFIFMNAVGIDDDMRTLLHEAGHAFHAFLCRQDPLVAYRHGPMEFNEVASMGMELLGGEFISVFYKKVDEKRSKESHLEDIVSLLVWVATVDCFQHWIYENPQHTPPEREEAWLNIRRRFGGFLIDWHGLEKEHTFLWHRQLHIFEVPFYYIEYGIAQLGSLQLWLNAKKNWGQAILNYRQALALGGSRPLPELFEKCGLKFDFSVETIAPLMEIVEEELKALDAS